MAFLKLYGKKDERSWLELARHLANATGRIWVVYYCGKRYHMCTDDQASPVNRKMVISICVPHTPKSLVVQPPFAKDVG